MTSLKKSIWSLALCVFLVLTGCATKVSRPLPSPKGSETFKVTRRATVVPTGKPMVWQFQTDSSNPASNVVFVILYSNDLTIPRVQWSVAVVATNRFAFPFGWTMGYASLYASNAVTRLISQ